MNGLWIRLKNVNIDAMNSWCFRLSKNACHWRYRSYEAKSISRTFDVCLSILITIFLNEICHIFCPCRCRSLNRWVEYAIEILCVDFQKPLPNSKMGFLNKWMRNAWIEYLDVSKWKLKKRCWKICMCFNLVMNQRKFLDNVTKYVIAWNFVWLKIQIISCVSK